MKRFFSILLILCLLPLALPASAANADTVLRVGLYYSSSALSEVTLESADGSHFSVGRFNGTTFAPSSALSSAAVTLTPTADSGVQVADASSGAVLYTSAAGEGVALHTDAALTTLKGNEYYGDFLIRADSSSRLTVINYVGIEDYVKGVLPYEMSASWNREALKAQAVCARSYALTNLGKHESLGFDLCNTTNCQVYNGTARATANSDAAVTETTGLVLTANGKPATGFFFSSDGGATEDNENVWGGDPISYLRGVQDPYEDSSTALNGSWSTTLTAAQVTSKLQAAGYSIGTVASVAVTKRTAMDNVNQVTVTDTSGKSITIKNSAVRSAFGLNSIRYTISSPNSGNTGSGGNLYVNQQPCTNVNGLYAIGGDGSVQAVGAINGQTVLTATGPETLQVSATSAPSTSAADSFTFTGTGWGHSVGMSQYGAKAMAEQGFTYDQILKFYFTGIEITA